MKCVFSSALYISWQKQTISHSFVYLMLLLIYLSRYIPFWLLWMKLISLHILCIHRIQSFPKTLLWFWFIESWKWSTRDWIIKFLWKFYQFNGNCAPITSIHKLKAFGKFQAQFSSCHKHIVFKTIFLLLLIIITT